MNNKRYLHIILIFLVCMISISAVNAADDSLNEINEADDNQEVILEDNINEDVLTNNENDELILEENNAEDKATLSEGTSTGTFTDLNNAINGNSDSTVTLNRNYTYNGVDNYDAAFKKGIVLNRPVTIDGQGHTLNGNNLSRIFYIRDTNKVIIKHINFITGNAGDAIGEGRTSQTVGNQTEVLIVGDQVRPDIGVPRTHEFQNSDRNQGWGDKRNNDFP